MTNVALQTPSPNPSPSSFILPLLPYPSPFIPPPPPSLSSLSLPPYPPISLPLILPPSLFLYSQVKFMSLEKEVFPFMAQDGQLFAFDLEGTYVHCMTIN